MYGMFDNRMADFVQAIPNRKTELQPLCGFFGLDEVGISAASEVCAGM